MLSIFPTLFTYSLVVPLVFRIVTGITFLLIGYKNIRNHEKLLIFSPNPVATKIIGVVELVGGLLLIVGMWTQVSSMILSCLLIIALSKKRIEGQSDISKETLALLALITASLIFLGPGFYAFDLPL